MSEQKPAGAPKQRVSRVEVYWTAVTYKTVMLYVALGLVVLFGAIYLSNPDVFTTLVKKVDALVGTPTGNAAFLDVKRARFVNLDGRVQVKRVDSVQWAVADYQTMLDKGDLVQTGADGVARIEFADGTTYTVKPETLVTVEENQVTTDKASQVGVHISSGAVDLTTGTWEVPGSKAEVTFENAVASLRANSHAAVRSDPSADNHEISVTAGSAEVNRQGQKMEVDQWQKLTFASQGPMTRTDILAPPDLVAPVNLQPIIVPDPKKTPIRFEWKPVATAVSYELQVSRTQMFTQVLASKKTSGTFVEVSGLDPGDYFWTVSASDGKEHTSLQSDPHKFSLVAQGKGEEMLLEIDSTDLHGNVVEISGRTEPGAALIINGQQVADIRPDGKFHHFTEPMSRGSHTIVITGQNRRGGTAIKRVEIVIP